MPRTIVLTSRTNPVIKETLKLKQKPAGVEGGLVLTEGILLVTEALSSGFPIERIFISTSLLHTEEGRSFLRRAAAGSAALIETTDRIIAMLSDTETPSGVVAVVPYVPAKLDTLSFRGEPLLVIIDGVQDPGNLGAIIRVSDAAAADAVIMMPGTCNPFMPKVVRATAGSIFHIPLVFTDQSHLRGFLDGKGIPLYATDARATLSLFECGLKAGFALALGNEARGVSDSLKRGADKSIAIPIAGRAESINVAMAASVCLYETLRQRNVLAAQSSGCIPDL